MDYLWNQRHRSSDLMGTVINIQNGDWIRRGELREYLRCYMDTVQILCIGTDMSQQTVQTKIRLLLKKQSDQGLRCLPFH